MINLEVPRKLAAGIRLKHAGKSLEPRFDEEQQGRDGDVTQLRFDPPFAERAELLLELPKGFADATGRALENAVRVLPAYALAHENLGDVYLRMAARAYEQAGRADPTNASSRRRLEAAREGAAIMRMVCVEGV